MPNSSFLRVLRLSQQVTVMAPFMAICVTASSGLTGQSRTDFVASRPSLAEAAEIAGPGAVVLEAGTTLLVDGSFRTIDVPEFTFRVGVAPRLELRLGAPVYSYLAGDGRSSSSVGEGSVQAKWLIRTTQPLRLGLLPVVRFPVDRTGEGKSGPLPALRLFADHPLGDFLLVLTTSVEDPSDSEVDPWFRQSVGLRKGTGESRIFFIEYNMSDGKDQPATHQIHAGYSFLLSRDLRLDVHGGRSLRRDALPFIGIGLALRL